MRLLVCSLEDTASINIRDRLLEIGGWKETKTFRSHPVFERGSDVMVTIDQVHLYADNLDVEATQALAQPFDPVVFLSRHRAASGIPTLTVHPIGNFAKAEYGGRPETLVPSAPDLMTSCLRELQKRSSGLPFQVGFEVTHHGPLLSVPTMFIEIGSGEQNWGDREAARAIASTLLEVKLIEAPKAIGIGGGHYAPRFSEVVATKRISFGHMIPNYFCDHASDERLLQVLEEARAKSGGADLVYIHKKSMARSRANHLKGLAEVAGARVVDSGDLADLD
jgi:D-aminoacyl-tRNA deacylase